MRERAATNDAAITAATLSNTTLKKERSMKKLLVCVAVVFAFALTVVAQDTGAGQSASGTKSTKTTKSTKSSSGSSMASGGSRTTTGCIDKSGDGYMLKNGRYKSGVKVTGSDDLGPHVGHTVKLTGNWTTPGKEFSETKVGMVSDTCKMNASSKGSGASMSSNSTTGSTKSGKKKGASSGAAGSTPPNF
jgi:hypothetical protein